LSRARRLPSSTTVEAFRWGQGQIESLPSNRSHAAVIHALSALPSLGSPAALPPPPAPPDFAELEREAFAKGFAQGERSGQEAANQRGEAMLRRLTQTLQELTELRSQMIRQTERQMVELALAVARRIVHREVSIDPDLLVAMARVALDRLGAAAQITVRLSPDDYQLTGAARVAHLTATNVTVVADGRIPRGGCQVESDMGTLDAGIDAQIHEIAQALLGRADAPVGAVILD
jgi:flagellar assembly protein FliH